ncbi:MAG: primosomal protein N' [Prolixibacteraceae bacterium]|nr:primosomal protein N' [Prolixibacteraceae bacterium]
MAELFAQIILPLSLHDSYTYAVPESMQNDIVPGQRAIVQFGSKRLYAGLVFSISESTERNTEIKEILQLLDDKPVVFPENLTLWKWIANYYCCQLGDVFRAALPAGLKLESKSILGSTGFDNEIELTNKEELLIREIVNGPVFLSEIQKKLGNDFSYSALKSIQEKKLATIEEKVTEKYLPKTVTFVKFHSQIKSAAILQEHINTLKKAKKQLALLYHFCDVTNAFEKEHKISISKKDLFNETSFSSAILNELCRKKILVQFHETVSRLEETADGQIEMSLLNPHQQEALNQIKDAFQNQQVTLIHGITASGKTEVYIHLIDEIIQAGKQVLYLVPEIALTTQIIHRLKNVFGNKVGIYHSKLSNSERVEIWEKVLQFKQNQNEGYQVILGARSSLFLPFYNLGLIVVDEEHENSFKQYDPAPRYHARDAAVVLGYQQNAKILLGSATPSVESYYNALTGKYALVNLLKKHARLESPEMIIADTNKAYKRKQMHSVLTPELYESVEKALENQEQVILFQNRRGYSPFIECFTCGWIPKCKNCDVSLTYHKYKKRLICHYCGYNIALSDSCDNCGSPELKTRGFGTEKIEAELKPMFKNAHIARMDMDTTKSKNAFEKIVRNIEDRKTDILVGTQMVTKGLDFEHVSIVGILNADNLINFPDFRAHERAYQLISQVSGRSGRKHKQGKVIVQTTQPDHQLLHLVKTQDYNTMIKNQLNERKLFKYPPFYRLIKIIVKHKKAETVDRAAQQLAEEIRKNKELIVLGPEYPLIGRIKLWYHKEIWIKLDRNLNLDSTKKNILANIEQIKSLPLNSNCFINVDVDPY